jgi:NAD(P)-dependent dehydrogenase (short-subunit alcohol dehydrogenase family)
MNGKNVVITGASGALGQVVVNMALARGATVVAVDHAAKTPASTATLLQIGGIDLSDALQATQAIATAASRAGGIDVLINVAGAFAYEMIDGGDNESWEKMHRLNLLTALNASRAATPHLVAAKAGRIVNIGAIGALQAGAGMGAYAASKAGVHRLTEALAAELKGKVTVNAVLPSTIDTAANRRDMPQADFSKWVTAQELAEVILFLASDAASAVTGALLPVSGRV